MHVCMLLLQVVSSDSPKLSTAAGRNGQSSANNNTIDSMISECTGVVGGVWLSKMLRLSMVRPFLLQLSVRMSTPTKDLYSARTPYDSHDKAFTRKDLVSLTNPLEQFNIWFEFAQSCQAIPEANAVCLATSSLSGQPSCRMVLMKQYSEEGFKFFTNYESRKAKDLEENPKASLLFYWAPLHRQVRIEGQVHRISKEESLVYFGSRPVSSQISAIVSNQSQEIVSRSELELKHRTLKGSCKASSLVKPDYWGGYVLVPCVYEFWQGHSDRLHDRLVYRKRDDDTWTVVRLAP